MVELKTVAVSVVVLMIFLNAGPGVLMASGVAADWGIVPSVSGGQSIDSGNQAMQNIEASGGFGQTLFGLYTTVTGPFKTLLGVVTAGPIMLASIGLPGWLVTFIFAPQYLIVGGAVIYVLAGRLL